MTAHPQKPGEQLAIEALASAGLTFKDLGNVSESVELATRYHEAIMYLGTLPASQPRADALRAIVKYREANGVRCDPLPTPEYLMGDAWLEEFERLGGTCRIAIEPDANGMNSRVVLKTSMPADSSSEDEDLLSSLRYRLGQNELAAQVILCLLDRTSWDELHGSIE